MVIGGGSGIVAQLGIFPIDAFPDFHPTVAVGAPVEYHMDDPVDPGIQLNRPPERLVGTPDARRFLPAEITPPFQHALGGIIGTDANRVFAGTFAASGVIMPLVDNVPLPLPAIGHDLEFARRQIDTETDPEFLALPVLTQHTFSGGQAQFGAVGVACAGHGSYRAADGGFHVTTAIPRRDRAFNGAPGTYLVAVVVPFSVIAATGVDFIVVNLARLEIFRHDELLISRPGQGIGAKTQDHSQSCYGNC